MATLDYIIDHLDHSFNVVQSFKPEALHFTLNDEEVSTIEYQISAGALDLSGNPIITGNDFVSPWNTHFKLRYGTHVIMAGPHTGWNTKYGDNYMSVSGKDWLAYFDRRFFPFDERAGHDNDYVIGTPPQGFSYEKTTSVDIATALTDILNKILGRPNSLTITYSLSATTVLLDYFNLSLGDISSLLSIIQSICSYNPGVAFEITPARVFQIASPRWYGSPDAIANNSASSSLIWTVNNTTHPPISLEFTNTGPGATHMLGQGDGNIPHAVALGNTANQEVYWRLDKAESFSNALTRASIEARTREQLAFDLNPIHEMPIVLDPAIVDTQKGSGDGWFWDNFKPGRAIWIDLQLIAHSINSAHHIVSMDCTVNPNGVCTVQLSENQIYDTSGLSQVFEG